MSPKNPVVSLSYLCIKIVSNQLIYALADDEGSNYEAVQKYLSDVTCQVIQDLLQYILNTEYLDAATRFSCLELLLSGNVQVLETGIFPHSYYEKILKVLLKLGRGLQHLNLKGVWVHDQPELLSRVVQKLQNLKSLIIPHIADDLVLQSVMSCDKLQTLNISGDCRFSPQVLENLSSCSIKILDIGSYGKKQFCQHEVESWQVMAKMIENFPNLTVIQTYSFLGNTLLNIYQKNPTFKTKLIYIHDTKTTIETCTAILNLCPNLESAYFDTPQENVLAMLTNLKNLKSLKLARFNCTELLAFLKHSGSQLHTLKLRSCKEDQLDLTRVCLYCPNLVNLDCFKINLSFLQNDYYFMSLQSLDILYCNVSDYILKCLLTNSPFLKRVVVGDVIRLTDGDLFRLCAECDFTCLEELWFSCARCLTATSVQLLMGHCPNLKSLGQLSGWDVSATDMDYLRAFIHFTNTNLILLPTGFP